MKTPSIEQNYLCKGVWSCLSSIKRVAWACLGASLNISFTISRLPCEQTICTGVESSTCFASKRPPYLEFQKSDSLQERKKFKRVFDTSLSVNSKKFDTFDNKNVKCFFIKKKNKQNAQLVPFSIKPLIFLVIKTLFMKRGRGCNMRP